MSVDFESAIKINFVSLNFTPPQAGWHSIRAALTGEHFVVIAIIVDLVMLI